MESRLDHYNKKDKIIYLLGDFNIDLLKFDSCNYSHKFLLMLQSCYLFPTIDKPTRVYNNSATLIDNICTNTPLNLAYSGNLVSDISDHYSQFCITSISKEKPYKTNKKIRHLSKEAIEDFFHDLSKKNLVNKNSDMSIYDVDKSFSVFYKTINNLVNKHAPITPLSKQTETDAQTMDNIWNS